MPFYDLVKMASMADWYGLFVAAIVCLVAATLGRRFTQPSLATPKPKSLTFRVDDIPVDHADGLDSTLQSIAEQDSVLRGDATTLVRRSLAPKDKLFVCTTVSITTHLSGESLCARLRAAGRDHSYSYSCTFEGITPLYDAGSGAVIDIIAVPGLGSHALGSWKSRNSDDVWLRDFLPKDVPNIRILLYGYDTTLPGSLSKQSIEDLGGTLLERITAFRARDGALVRAQSRRTEANSDLSKASFGLLFFGVPNLGLQNDQLRTLVQGQPNEALIHDLLVDKESEPSTFLKRLADQFSESCKGHYRVVSFFERVLSPTIELDRDGRWRKTGQPSLLVTGKSATSTGIVTVAEEDNISLNTDHSGLVKYDSKSQGDYTIVRARIASLVDEAEREVVKRFAEQNLYLPQSKTTQACLRSLAFEDMDGRHNRIDAAAAGTCEWLLEHKTLEKWICQHRGLLWLKGKPGSGKSTLLKHALRRVPSFYGTDTLTLSFFFHGRGHEMQRTPLGLFRSLLHQLLSRVPGTLHDLMDDFENRCRTVGEPGEKWQWHLQPLQTFLESSLAKTLKRLPVIIFVDALDECGEQSAVEVIRYLKQLLASLPLTDSRLGVCFSCRHYPILELDHGLTILLDIENKADITRYVRAHFSTDLDVPIQELITQRAEGVFMWAQFVVDRVLQLKRQGESRGKIEVEIMQMPPALEDLYHTLISGVENRLEAFKLMQWICFATRPLTPDELSWAMAIDSDCAYRSLNECQKSDNFITGDTMERRIQSLSCGLAEVVPSANARRVQFIHQSVKDYFINRGFFLLDNTIVGFDLVIPTAHCRLTWSCIRYFKLVISSQSEDVSVDDEQKFPLLHYAMTSWVTHFQLGEKVETSEETFLTLLEWPQSLLVDEFARVHQSFRPYRIARGSKLLHLVSRYNLAKLLSYMLLHECDNIVDSKDNDDRSPLSLAAKNGHEAIVKMLLNTGKVEVDSRDKFNQSILSWTASNGHESIVKMILDTKKVSMDSRDNYGRSPLLWAAGNGHESIVKMLLDTGKVDLDLRDNYRRSPLSWAAENGHESIVKMLLDTGKINVDLKSNDGRSLLSWAAENGHESIVKMLLDTGKVNIDSRDTKYGQSPLSWAATNGHESIVKMLLDTGKVEVNLRDIQYGQSPLSWAAKNGHESIVKMLLDTRKVEVNLRDIQYGQSPLSWAATNGHESIVKMLLDTEKVDVDSRDKFNRSLLSWAAGNGHEAVVRMILDTRKVDVNSRDTSGRTALSWAVSKDEEKTALLLLENEDIDISSSDDNGYTPLMRALWRSHTAMAKLLLQRGCKVQEPCKDGLVIQAFKVMPAIELDQFIADIGYVKGDDIFGLNELFREPCTV